jgi:hypothetical protein
MNRFPSFATAKAENFIRLLPLLFVLFGDTSPAQTTCGDSTYGLREITQIDMLGYVTGFSDLNNNGKLDLAGLGPLVPNGTYYTKIYERESDTTYTEVFIGNDVNLDFLEWTGDSDADGLGELLVSRWFNPGKVPTRKLFLYESRDSLSYPDTANVIWTYVKGSYNFNPIYCQDLDQDGRREFVFTDFDSTWAFMVFEATGDNTYTLVSDPLRFLGSAEVSGLSFGDLDGDGLQEVMLGRENGEVRVIENVADDTYTFTWSGDTDVSGSYASTYLGDSDVDGRNEFVVGGYEPGVYHLLTVFESNGDNSCTEIWETMIYNFPFGIQTLKTGDIDGDGINEFAFYNSGDSTWFYEAISDNIFACLANVTGGYWFQLYDLNQNGRTEFTRLSFDNTLVFEYDSLLTDVGDRFHYVLPAAIELYQNYPNPFNSSTLIRYVLAASTWVRLTIYDITGTKVSTMLNRPQEPGHHNITWNGRDSHGRPVASGTYFIRLNTQDQSKSIKALIVR